MKYIRFKSEDSVEYGILEGSEIVQLKNSYFSGDVERTENIYNLSDVEILPPVDPGKIIAIGLNYAKHAEESNKSVPEEPMIFMVSQTAIVGNNKEIILPNDEDKIDFEAELAIVIGEKAKNLSYEDSLDYVLGYTITNDVSNRNLQKKDGQFTRAKSYDTFKPIGPHIETDLNPNNVEISLTQNGEIKQRSNTNDLIHDIQSLLVHITKVFTLNPGDVVITGTPSGVGPMRDGDEIVIEIEGIGKLRNTVRV